MWQDYEVLEEIGSGASGVVYRARHRGLGRLVALKVLRSPEVGPDEAERFRREAARAANLDHPNIAPVYEVGEHEGRLYCSMKLIEGADLSRAVAALWGSTALPTSNAPWHWIHDGFAVALRGSTALPTFNWTELAATLASVACA